jgi:hypothetical protein
MAHCWTSKDRKQNRPDDDRIVLQFPGVWKFQYNVYWEWIVAYFALFNQSIIECLTQLSKRCRIIANSSVHLTVNSALVSIVLTNHAPYAGELENSHRIKHLSWSYTLAATSSFSLTTCKTPHRSPYGLKFFEKDWQASNS